MPKRKPTKPPDTGYATRKSEIGKTIHDAMSAYEKTHQVDWQKGNYDEINESMMQFVEGRVSREDVKQVYKRFVESCRV